MASSSSKQHRQVLEDALGKPLVSKIWSANVESLLPLTFNDVDLQAIMPAVLFTLRWGSRRGQGSFVHSYVKEGSQVSAKAIAEGVLQTGRESGKFLVNPRLSSDVVTLTLANLVSGLCFDNRKSIPGIDQPVQRVYPVHYLASKIDLPEYVANLRGVPEYIVGILTRCGLHRSTVPLPGVLRSLSDEFNTLGVLHLLSLFASAIDIDSDEATRVANLGNTIESVNETTAGELGVDELLMIRIAERIERFPSRQKASQTGYRPPESITTRQNGIFEHDLRDVLRFYGLDLPRARLNRALEVIIGLNLFATLSSYARILHVWFDTGSVLVEGGQRPYKVFVDCSNGQNKEIRRSAEECFGEALRRYLSTVMPAKVYQIVSSEAMLDRLTNFPPSGSDPRALLEEAGAILNSEDHRVISGLRRKADDLYAELTESEEDKLLAANLTQEESPAVGLARVVREMMGAKLLEGNMVQLLDSVLGAGRDERGTSMIAKRRSQKSRGGVSREYSMERSLRLSDDALETLVHRLRIDPIIGKERRYTVQQFIDDIADRYGLCVDRAGDLDVAVPAEILRRNRENLEDRLRALSLLEGVNDAENMKVLQGRYNLRDGYKYLMSGDMA